jgi:hypothetical protein
MLSLVTGILKQQWILMPLIKLYQASLIVAVGVYRGVNLAVRLVNALKFPCFVRSATHKIGTGCLIAKINGA